MTISDVINFFMSAIAVAMLMPCALLSAELIGALLPRRKASQPAPDRQTRVAVLIPAHNESAMIGHTVASILPHLHAADRLLVVADNCSDDTAILARAAGAQVIERKDPILRGKGYALDFGVRHLSNDPPDVLVMADADISIRPGSIDALVRQVIHTGRPAQSVYVLRAPDNVDVKDAMSQLAFTVRNHIRARGLSRLAGVCPLFGAGMAFPWQIIATAPLANGNIVEDLALGLDLCAAGHAPLLCEDSRIDGTLVAIQTEPDLKQRRRWEHGHLRTLFGHAPRTLLRAARTFRPRAAVLALDVMIPPLSLMAISLLLASIGLLLMSLIPGVSVLPALLLLAGMSVNALLIGITWGRFAECEHPLRPLLAMPGYVLRKLPLYLSFFTHAETSWHRAARPPTIKFDPHKPAPVSGGRSSNRAA